ncbi:MAG: Rho-binding antiterminator [Arenicella sp.]|jgi:Rho-binding antiterminator|nr:Rho-binding antiterminator [Arenicella sp.]
MMPVQPLSCDLHDYIEIACLYSYALKLTLTDSTVINAVAIDTKMSNKQEFIVVKDVKVESGKPEWTDNEHSLVEIPLKSLDKIEALSLNAKFGVIKF